jgi:hypothetical protein
LQKKTGFLEGLKPSFFLFERYDFHGFFTPQLGSILPERRYREATIKSDLNNLQVHCKEKDRSPFCLKGAKDQRRPFAKLLKHFQVNLLEFSQIYVARSKDGI